MMTGEETCRQRGDQILEGGMWATVFTAPKQFKLPLELSRHGMAGAITTVRPPHPYILDGKS